MEGALNPVTTELFSGFTDGAHPTDTQALALSDCRDTAALMEVAFHDVAHDTRQRLETQIQQVERCATHLYPGRAPQERVLNPAYYLTRYGSAFIDSAASATASAIAASLATAGDDG